MAEASADEEAWPELDDDCLPVFPVELLPAGFDEFVAKAAASVHAPVDYAAAALLGTVSSALTGRVFVRIKSGFVKPLQLYLGLIGPSGSGKSPVMNMMIDPLRTWLCERRKHIRQLNTANAVEGRELLAEAEAVVSDITPEALLKTLARQGGCGIIYAEEGSIANILSGSTYSGKGSQTNIDVFLNASDGAGVYCDRVGQTEPVDLPHVHLSMTMALQPKLLESFAKDPSLADRGLPQRMLFFLAEPLGAYSVYDEPEVPEEMLAMWRKKVEELAGAYRDNSRVLSMSDAARAEYLAFKQCMVNRSTEDLGESEVIRSWTQKAHEKAARLAGLLTMLADVHAAEISQICMRSACRMMNEYFIPHMKVVFGSRGSISREAQAVLKAIQAMAAVQDAPLMESLIAKKVSGQSCFKGENGKMRFRNALDELASKRFIRQADVRAARTGRPSRGAWELHPGLKK